MRHVCCRTLTLISFAFLISCSNAVPTVTELQSQLKTPTFAGALTKNYVIPTYSTPVTVSGECDRDTADLKWSTDAGTTFVTPGFGGGDYDCTDGTFSFTIPDGSFVGLSVGSPRGTVVSLLLRSETTAGGYTGNSTFSIQLNAGHFGRFTDLASGGGVFNGSNLKLTGKIGAPKTRVSMTGSSHKIRLTGEN